MEYIWEKKIEDIETTAELVREEIKSSLFLNETLKKGLINYSALVRLLLPKIQLKNKKANFQSVLIAIQRYYDEHKEKSDKDILGELLKDSELIMKNRIYSLTIERTKPAMSLINKVSQEIRWDMGDIMFFIQGSAEITIIIDEKNKKKFDCLGKKIIEKKANLSLLSLREVGETTSYSKDVPGFLSALTSTLSDNSINVIDIASTYRQIIFVLDEKDLTRAYESLDKLIKHYNTK